MARLVAAAVVVCLLGAGCMAAPAAQEPDEGRARIKSTRSAGGPGAEEGNTSAAPDFANISRFWGDRTSHVVLNRALRWHDDASPAITALYTALHVLGPPCVWEDTAVYLSNRRVRFEPASQTVWPGTKAIEVTLNWNTTDYARERLALAYRSGAGDRVYNQTPLFPRGQTFRIEVEPAHWDASDSQRTAWDIWVCISDHNGSTFDPGPPFVGSVHVHIRLLRGEYAEGAD